MQNRTIQFMFYEKTIEVLGNVHKLRQYKLVALFSTLPPHQYSSDLKIIDPPTYHQDSSDF